MPGRYYGYYYYDPTYMLIVISALISLFAQFLVNSRFSKYSRVRSRSGMTGAQAADVFCSHRAFMMWQSSGYREN